MIKYISIFILVISFTSCKSISINKETQKITTQNIQLGTVGEQKSFLLEQDYNHTALPNYKTPIKVFVNALNFNKSTFKAFTNAKINQTKKVTINYVDSLEIKPKYLKLDIADRVAVLNTLNSKTNKDVFQFLKNKDESHIVTSISLALSNTDIKAVSNADEVFLEVTGIKNYALKLYKDKTVKQTILFSDSVVFSYKTSSCCWKQNDKYQLKVVDLAEGGNDCPNQSYKSSKRAKKDINYYKL